MARPKRRTQAAFGDFLRKQRAKLGISINELGRRSSVSGSYLSEIEKGIKAPSARVVEDLARSLDVERWRLEQLTDLPPRSDIELLAKAGTSLRKEVLAARKRLRAWLRKTKV